MHLQIISVLISY